MTVMVIGGQGFIGSHLCVAMAEQGEDVVCYDSASRIPPLLTAAPEEVNRRIRIVRGSVLDVARLISVAKERGVEGIIQPAAVLPPTSEELPMEALKVNVLGVANVCEAARILDLRRFVCFSSQGVYGARASLEPLAEDEPVDPTAGMYQASKYMGEITGCQYALQYGVPFIAIRTSMVFGPGQSFLYPLNVIVGHALKRIPLKWIDGGDHPLDYTYVKDVCHGAILAYKAVSPRHRVYNIAGSRLVTNFDILRLVKQHIADAPIEMGPGLLSNPPLYRKILTGPLSVNRAREDLAFEHRYGFEGGLGEYIEHLQRTPEELEAMVRSL
ncbi:MAG: NAD-dependent epimerase/dehydratase family protein [Candidatus Bathyarchaeia archaeon]